MSNGPLESVSSFRRDTLNIVSVEVLFFGFYTCLFIVTVYSVWTCNNDSSSKGQRRKVAQSSLLLASYILSALHCAFDWWYPAHIFETNGASPTLVLDFLAKQPKFFLAMEGLTLSLSTGLTDSISAWRCWILYNRKKRVILFPVICILGSLIMGIITVADRVNFTVNLSQMSLDDVNAGIDRWQRLLIAYFAMSLGATLYTTGMILYQLVVVHLRVSKFTRPSFSSSRVAILIAESALLYTISHIVTMSLLTRVSPKFNFSQDILAQMSGISPCLLMLRVSLPTPHKNAQTHVEEMSTLKFSEENQGDNLRAT